MSVAIRRSRLVNFKVSELELERLQKACVVVQARSLSDFTRQATLAYAAGALVDPHQSPNSAGLETINDRLDKLDSRLAQLVEWLEDAHSVGAVAATVPSAKVRVHTEPH